MAADLTAFLANCFVGGEIGSVHPGGRWVRDTIELRLGGRDVSIVQGPAGLASGAGDHNGFFVKTTTVVVREVRAEERPQVWELLERLSWLLSFAGCSEVVCYGWDHPEDPPLRNVHWLTVARARYARPTLAIRQGEVVRRFLEGVWPEYVRVDEVRDLDRTIALFVIAETHGLPLELKLATMFIMLEKLKSTYAREQNYARRGASWERPDGVRLWFRGLLEEMLAAEDMESFQLEAVVSLRNEIVHSGVSELSFDEQMALYEVCQDLAREYLLRSWGYSGEFRLYGGRGMETKRI